MKKILTLCSVMALILVCVVGFAACEKNDSEPETVNWLAISANGTANTVTTTELTLTFDRDITTLSTDNITVTGATKGTLSGIGMTRKLTITNITVTEGENITVAISNPDGFTISPSSKMVAVHKAVVGEAEVMSLADFIMEIQKVDGNYSITANIEDNLEKKFLLRCEIEVDDAVSKFYAYGREIPDDPDSETWGFYHIRGEETDFYYSTDGIEFSIRTLSTKANPIHDYYSELGLIGFITSDTDNFIMDTVKENTYNLKNEIELIYSGDPPFHATVATIEIQTEKVLLSITINNGDREIIYKLEITFGTARVTEADLPATE